MFRRTLAALKSPVSGKIAALRLTLALMGIAAALGVVPVTAEAATCNCDVTVSPSTASCSAAVGQQVACGSFSVSTYVTGFLLSVSSNNSAFAITRNGDSFSVKFQPVSAGAQTATITATWEEDAYDLFTGEVTVTGNAAQPTIGTLTVSPSTLNCGTATVGVSANCGALTLTATGGPVALPSPLYTLSASTGLLVSGGTCSAGESLNSGQSCTLGPVDLDASSPGSYSATLTVNTVSSGSVSVALAGNALAFECRPDPANSKFCLVAPLK